MTGAFSWRILRSGRKAVVGSIDFKGYRVVTIKGERHFAHRLAWLYVYGEWPNWFLDHIDGNKANNQIENLRLVSYRENAFNKNSTRTLGVIWEKKRSQWKTTIGFQKKIIFLGRYQDKRVAIKVRRAAEKKYFGEYAKW